MYERKHFFQVIEKLAIFLIYAFIYENLLVSHKSQHVCLCTIIAFHRKFPFMLILQNTKMKNMILMHQNSIMTCLPKVIR